jgi:hypothetical protein
MPDEPLLREKAREALRSGKLPTAQASHTYGGRASGTTTCAVCWQTIARDETELDAEFDRSGMSPDVYHFHPRCFAAWEFERTKLPSDRI